MTGKKILGKPVIDCCMAGFAGSPKSSILSLQMVSGVLTPAGICTTIVRCSVEGQVLQETVETHRSQGNVFHGTIVNLGKLIHLQRLLILSVAKASHGGTQTVGQETCDSAIES